MFLRPLPELRWNETFENWTTNNSETEMILFLLSQELKRIVNGIEFLFRVPVAQTQRIVICSDVSTHTKKMFSHIIFSLKFSLFTVNLIADLNNRT